MLKQIFILFFCLIRLNLISQNLVPNYSFETFTMCPTTSNQVTVAIPWGAATATSSTDYFNSCSLTFNVPNYPGGFQKAKTGLGYVGMWLFQPSNYREYLQVKLDSALKINRCYEVSFYVNLHDANTLNAGNNISANLSITQPTAPFPGALMSLTPHITKIGNPIINDSINWVKISGSYFAAGGEQYLTIGNFFDNANTITTGASSATASGYYFIDDVNVSELIDARCTNDTVVCNPTDSVLLGLNQTENASYSWQPNIGLSCSFCPNPKALPNTTTKYILTKQVCNLITKDSVTIAVKNDCNSFVSIPNVFTPNGDNVNDTFKIVLGDVTTIDFKLYNRWGNLIHETSNKTILWDGRTTSGEPCTNGVYFYTLKYIDGNGVSQNKTGYISLFR